MTKAQRVISLVEVASQKHFVEKLQRLLEKVAMKPEKNFINIAKIVVTQISSTNAEE